jgi:hypothetical protein
MVSIKYKHPFFGLKGVIVSTKDFYFHSWEIYTENSSVLLRFGLHDPKGISQTLKSQIPNIYFRKGKITNSRDHLCSYNLEI